MPRILVSALLFISISAQAKGTEGFIEMNPYLLESSEFHCATLSKDNWSVSLSRGKIQIESAKKYADKTELKMSGGKFIARDRGEAGGGLDFVKGKVTQEIFVQSISALFPLPNFRVAAFGGITHNGLDEGYLLLIGKPALAANWKIEQQFRLPANPQAVTWMSPNAFLFVTEEGLYSFEWGTGNTQQLKLTPLKGLDPNSIVMTSDRHIYAGMRHVVAHFIPAKNGGYTVKWLMKRRCGGTKLINGVPHSVYQ